MIPLVREWLEKAEGDVAGAEVLLRSRRKGVNDLVCFHCQQAVEKFLKARLQAADIRFPKTHALSELLALIAPVEPLWLVLASPLPVLESYAVEARYPGRSVTRREAVEAMRIMRQVRGMVRERLVPGVGRRSKK